jgi:sortase A
MRLARVLGAAGRILITSGVLILLFVAYQLWGTGIREAQAQNRLERDFERVLQDVGGGGNGGNDDRPRRSTTTTIPEDPTVASTVPTEAGSTPPPVLGGPIGRIEIPSIGVDKIVVEGVTLDDLQNGPGHYPETPLPGQEGNAAIAGHRTTYGAPFHRLDELNVGDEIFVETIQGRFRYEVVDAEESAPEVAHRIVYPDQTEVLDDYDDNRLTLTACHPKYSAAQRIVVVAKMSKGQEAKPFVPTKQQEQKRQERSFEDIDGEGKPRWPVILIGLVCAAIWFAAWLVGRWWRPWPAYLLGLPFFLIALFFFFEEFSRLLPNSY